MSFPWSTAQTNAVARLLTYNGTAYDATSNPKGFGLGGHVQNLIPVLQDLAVSAQAASEAADAAGIYANSASIDAANAALSAARLQGTSTTSQPIGTGSKSFTTQSGKLFPVGAYVTLVSAANPNINKMSGEVTAYSGTALTVNVDTILGSGTYTDWLIYLTGRPGQTGNIGPAGTIGPTPARQWNFSNATADADPGTGLFRINNASYGSATTWYIDNQDKDSNDATSFLDFWDDSTNTNRGIIYAVQISDPTKRLQARVTGSIVDGTGYRKVTVSPIAGATFSFDNGAAVAISFSPSGDKGANGAGAGTVIGDSGSTSVDDFVVWNSTDGVHVKTSGISTGTSGARLSRLDGTNTWSGVQSIAAKLDVQQDIAFSGDITPAQITSDQNDYAPTGHATASTWRLTSDTVRNINGFSGGYDGRLIIVANENTTASIILKEENTGSTAANRFSLGGADIVLGPKQRAIVQYDATSSRWKAVSYTGRKAWTVTKVTATNATWPVPAGTTEMKVEAWGGGASGAAGDTNGPGARGSGGGAGGYVTKYFSGLMDATLNITIGAGGAGTTATAGGAVGNHGSATSVVGTNLGTLTANGGSRGVPATAGGGLGGTATGGDENITGQDGGTGYNLPTVFGFGGSSPRGGQGAMTNVSANGGAPGGGGSAGNHTGGAVSGAGAAGYVMVWTR